MGRNEEKKKYKPMDRLYRDKETGKLIQVISEWDGTGTSSLNENDKLIPISVQPSQEGDEHDIWIQRTEVGYIVTVGGKNYIHPKGEDHYIEHLELEANGRVYRIKMTPFDSPVKTFILTYAPIVYVRALCSRHGLFEKVYVEMDMDVEADSDNLYHEWASEKPRNEWDDSLKRIEAKRQEMIKEKKDKDNS
jgi:desulfoferrodoxin (superoxide reductase-like protein)